MNLLPSHPRVSLALPHSRLDGNEEGPRRGPTERNHDVLVRRGRDMNLTDAHRAHHLESSLAKSSARGGAAQPNSANPANCHLSIKTVQEATRQFLMRDSDYSSLALAMLNSVIAQEVNVIESLLLRAFVKMELRDWRGCLDDCNNVLHLAPSQPAALMLRCVARVRAPVDGPMAEYGERVGQDIIAVSELQDERFAVLVKYGVTEITDNQAIKDIGKLVDADPYDRCATAMLLTARFVRWYWDPSSTNLSNASELAHTMQNRWPNDLIAMSVVSHLEGALGRVDLSAIDPVLPNTKTAGVLYHKAEIRPMLAFEYPVRIQVPGLALLPLV